MLPSLGTFSVEKWPENTHISMMMDSQQQHLECRKIARIFAKTQWVLIALRLLCSGIWLGTKYEKWLGNFPSALYTHTQFQEISSRQLYNFRRAQYIFELASMILQNCYCNDFREEYNHQQLKKNNLKNICGFLQEGSRSVGAVKQQHTKV